MYICIFIDSPKGCKASIPFIHFFYIFSLFSRITFSFPFYTTFYIFFIVYIKFYFIFYLILLFSARLVTPRTRRSLALLFLSPYLHISYYSLYSCTQSPFPSLSTSVSLSFIPFSLPFLFLSSPPPPSSPLPVLLSLFPLSISVIHSSLLPSSSSISFILSPIPLPPFCTESIRYMFQRFFLSPTYSTPSLLFRSPVPTFPHLISHSIPRYSFLPSLFPSHLYVFRYSPSTVISQYHLLYLD